jgi:hypothetical protein
MHKTIQLLTLIVVALATVMWNAPAQAQATRTWVSGVGDDANPCSRTAPCKTFAGAISKTAPAGIINCIDPGGFGAVTITKSITIDCRPVMGGVLVSGTNAINVPTAGLVVNLRGLDIEGIGTGLIGVNITGGGTGSVVHIEDSKIFGFQSGAATGVNFAPTAAGGQLIIINTHIHTNGTGVALTGSSAVGNASFRDVVVDQNSANGISLVTTGPHIGATVDRSTIALNGGTGLSVNGAAALAVVGNSTITGNATGVANVGGAGIMWSFKNNQIAGNTTDGTPVTAFPGPNSSPLQ